MYLWRGPAARGEDFRQGKGNAAVPQGPRCLVAGASLFGFRVSGFGFQVWVRVWGLGFGFGVSGSRFRVSGLSQAFGFEVDGLGRSFRVFCVRATLSRRRFRA